MSTYSHILTDLGCHNREDREQKQQFYIKKSSLHIIIFTAYLHILAVVGSPDTVGFLLNLHLELNRLVDGVELRGLTLSCQVVVNRVNL